MTEQQRTPIPNDLPELKMLEEALAKTTLPGQRSPFQLPDIKPPDVARLAGNFNRIAQHSQHLVQNYLKYQADPHANFYFPDPAHVGQSFIEMTHKMMADPTALAQAQIKFWQDYVTLWQTTSRRMLGENIEPAVTPDAADKRFKEEEWTKNAIFDFIKQSYLLTARSIQGMVRNVEGLDPKTAEKVDFYTRQFVDTMSPTNFTLTNPKVLKTTLETGGENLTTGLANLLEDLVEGQGRLRIKMTDTTAFELGRNIATTPGKIVYQTDLMQLIQYNPSTERVYRRPLLIIPPWINKYYILDLQPKNSLVKWAVDQGFTVFVVSWVNPDEKLANMDFEHYLSHGSLAALDAIEQATGERQVNAIGYCIGGTLLMCTLAYMAARKDKRITSATCFTTMLDFTHVGELSVFIDEEQFAHVDKGMESKGFLEGRYMAGVFNMLRANDLIWSFVIRNYLLGEEPFPFDLLYWNSDSTRMPMAMHSFYLRNMYLNNKLKDPGGISLLDQSIDLGKIKVPIYFLSAKEDHIAPWRSTYAGVRLPSGPITFVLGESGHIAGVVNPPAAKKYSHWTNTTLPATPEEWAETAVQHEGSWWLNWLEWIKPKAGEEVPARQPGDGKLEPLEDAPGSYVNYRAT